MAVVFRQTFKMPILNCLLYFNYNLKSIHKAKDISISETVHLRILQTFIESRLSSTKTGLLLVWVCCSMHHRFCDNLKWSFFSEPVSIL
jgi:hypothetical protein